MAHCVEHPAISVQNAVFDGGSALPALRPFNKGLLRSFAIIGVKNIKRLPANHLFGRVAKIEGRRRIDIRKHSLRVYFRDELIGRLDDALKTRKLGHALAQMLVFSLQCGKVGWRHDDTPVWWGWEAESK